METGVTETPLERRLAAVLALDTVGYSRLMEADVEGTHRRLGVAMAAIIEPAIADQGGRIVKKTGDGALVEFPSVSRALHAALRIQGRITEAEQDRPADRLRFRIGINLADIIVAEDHDIYGDGVNIAARLEGIGQPSDVVVSEAAMQTADHAAFRFVDLGPQRLKNIARPVRAFRLLPPGAAPQSDEGGLTSLVPGFGARPAIGVLPFHYVGGDPEQDVFADGLTDEVTTALARWRAFPVISRNSMFAFKGEPIDLRAFGQRVGARYLVEGRIRRSGARMRTAIELADSDTAETLISEQFDCDLRDVFTVQEEIAGSIMSTIEPELLRHERDRAALIAPHNATAYESYQRGMWYHYRYNAADAEHARFWFRAALAAVPGYPQAAAALAIALLQAANSGWAAERQPFLDEGLALARAAAQADPRDPLTRFALGLAYHWHGMRQQSIAELSEALQLDPSHAAAHANLAFVYNYLNKPKAALREIEVALRLSPHDSRRFMWLPAVAVSRYLLGDYKATLAAAQKALTLKPDYPIAVRYLAAALGQLGLRTEAAGVVALMRRIDGDLATTIDLLRKVFIEPCVAHIADGLAKAGFD